MGEPGAMATKELILMSLYWELTSTAHSFIINAAKTSIPVSRAPRKVSAPQHFFSSLCSQFPLKQSTVIVCNLYYLIFFWKLERNPPILSVLRFWKADNDTLQVSAQLHSDLLFYFIQGLLAIAFLLRADLTSKWLFSSLMLILTAKELAGAFHPIVSHS